MMEVSIFPIPLRPNLTIKIQGIPYDLTQKEANYLTAIITAFAVPVPPKEPTP